MIIAAYKGEKVIGYLTIWSVCGEMLDKLLNYEQLESNVDFTKDLYTYNKKNIHICLYVSGLGLCNEERSMKNHPLVLQQLFNK